MIQMTPTTSFDCAKFVGDPQPERRDDGGATEDFLALLFAAVPGPAIPVYSGAAAEPESTDLRPAVDCTDLPIPTDDPMSTIPPTVGTVPIPLPPDIIPERKAPPSPDMMPPDIVRSPPVPQPFDLHKDVPGFRPRFNADSRQPAERFVEKQSETSGTEMSPQGQVTADIRTIVPPRGGISDPRRQEDAVRMAAAPAPSAAVTAESSNRSVDIKADLTGLIGEPSEVRGLQDDRPTSLVAELGALSQLEEREEAAKGQPNHHEPVNVGETILRKFGTGFEPTVEPANAERALELSPEELVDQIAPKLIEVAAPEGADRRFLKMRLHPAELGAVDIELERDESGSLTARIHTESVAAQHILVEGLDQLRDALQNSGWTINELQVESGLGPANGDADGRESQQQSPERPDIRESAAQTLTPQDAPAAAGGLVSLRA